jgi:hypothetical protein
MAFAIVRELEGGGEAGFSSEATGEILLEHLCEVEDVVPLVFAGFASTEPAKSIMA